MYIYLNSFAIFTNFEIFHQIRKNKTYSQEDILLRRSPARAKKIGTRFYVIIYILYTYHICFRREITYVYINQFFKEILKSGSCRNTRADRHSISKKSQTFQEQKRRKKRYVNSFPAIFRDFHLLINDLGYNPQFPLCFACLAFSVYLWHLLLFKPFNMQSQIKDM